MAGFVEVEGGRLGYEVDGAGEPIVFVHGFGLDGRMWDGEAAHFSRDYAVVRYDVRGFGRSSPPTGPFAHVEAIFAALVSHLGFARAHLCGLSMGGGIAIDFALAHPARVHALVLVDSVVGGFPFPRGTAPLTASMAAAKTAVSRRRARRGWRARCSRRCWRGPSWRRNCARSSTATRAGTG